MEPFISSSTTARARKQIARYSPCNVTVRVTVSTFHSSKTSSRNNHRVRITAQQPSPHSANVLEIRLRRQRRRRARETTSRSHYRFGDGRLLYVASPRSRRHAVDDFVQLVGVIPEKRKRARRRLVRAIRKAVDLRGGFRQSFIVSVYSSTNVSYA